MPSTIIASKEPLETPIDALSNSPRARPPLKPELETYISLNFVGGVVTVNKNDDENASAASSRTLSGGRDNGQGRGDRGGGTGVNDGSDGSQEADDALWRGSRGVYTGTKTRNEPADSSPASSLERGRTKDPSGTSNNTAAQDTGDCGDSEEVLLYPRTLGSSVSVLDEKDAVLRTGGARFAGEDPIRGRLRATDPFLWMGRLRAGATAISGLIDQAKGALDGLEGGGSDGDSVTSGGGGRNSSDNRRLEGLSDWREGMAGQISVSGENTSKQWMEGGATGEQKVDDGWQTVGKDDGRGGGNSDEDKHGGDGKTHATHTSSGSNAALEQISSTMSAYSHAMEANRIITGGVVLEGEQEEDHENDRDVSERIRSHFTWSDEDPTEMRVGSRIRSTHGTMLKGEHFAGGRQERRRRVGRSCLVQECLV